jgi:hypothetical protein
MEYSRNRFDEPKKTKSVALFINDSFITIVYTRQNARLTALDPKQAVSRSSRTPFADNGLRKNLAQISGAAPAPCDD